VVEELNRRLEKALGLTLRVVGWPEDVRPGVNADAQAEINRQVGSDYDLYVGVLGARFGTPTPRAGSGTAEELDRAIDGFRSNPRAMRVLLYFKRSVADPFTMDVDQLARVQAFRESLPKRGVLYRDFNDTADFVGLVTGHIHDLIVDEWRDGQWVDVQFKSPTDQTSPSAGMSVQEGLSPASEDGFAEATSQDSGDDLEPGFLDYMDAFHEGAAKANDAMTVLASCTEMIGQRMQDRTVEITTLKEEHEQAVPVGGSRVQQEYVRKARQAVDRAAADLDEFVSTMAPAVDAYRSAARQMFGNLRQALTQGSELKAEPERLEENRRALSNLISVMEASRASTVSFQTTVRQVPALTGRFRRSRQHAAAVLGNVIAELSFGIDEARALLQQLEGDTSGSEV
jgi:hypothetical protein